MFFHSDWSAETSSLFFASWHIQNTKRYILLSRNRHGLPDLTSSTRPARFLRLHQWKNLHTSCRYPTGHSTPLSPSKPGKPPLVLDDQLKDHIGTRAAVFYYSGKFRQGATRLRSSNILHWARSHCLDKEESAMASQRSGIFFEDLGL